MEALQSLLAQYTAQAPTRHEDLRFFSIFRHKLSATELAQVTAWRDALVKAAPPSMSGAGTGKATAKQKAKVQKTAEDKKAAVRAAL
eukprot:3486085-Amphidinium_carterae.1